ncbi:MAG: hypothetical protein IKL16_06185 [Clostridia bacterium]|nr:hypothetical protein [Clostridia bacterium]
MKRISSLLSEYDGRIYIFLEDEKTKNKFVKQAILEGFTFSDGVNLSSRSIDNIIAINRNLTVNFVGTIGRIAFQCADKIGNEKLHKINYKELM